MIIHYFTLQALSKELHILLCGSTLKEVFTQHKNELLITFESMTDGRADENSGTLCISVEPRFNYIVIRDRLVRARKNSVDLFQTIVGTTIHQVSIQPWDRTLIFVLQDFRKLFIQLYNSAASNIVLVDGKNIIQKSFKKDRELAGTVFKFAERSFDEQLLRSEKEFADIVLHYPEHTIYSALKQTIPVLGSLYMHEVLFRANIRDDAKVQEISKDDLHSLHEKIKNIVDETSNPRPMIYFYGGRIKEFSVVELKHLSTLEQKTFSSVNEAIQRMVVSVFREEGIESEKSLLMKRIQNNLEQLIRKLEKMNESKQVEAEKYEHIGKLLFSHLSEVRKGMTQIILKDDYADSDLIEISLNRSLTPAQNAEQYFDKSKKLKASIEETAKRRKQINDETEMLKMLEHNLGKCVTHLELKDFKIKYEQELRTLKLLNEKAGKEQPPFRIFSVDGGFEVWVGKSSANNDLLTMKYSKPNDLWFHVRGASGSHTVLKVKSDVENIPREAIRQAASIAAYYSKMRKAGTIPVAYCERKYVRKPKGLAIGAVVLEREKVIFVSPSLP